MRSALFRSPESIAQLRSDYESGLSQSQIAKKNGTTQPIVRRAMVRLGIPARHKEEGDLVGQTVGWLLVEATAPRPVNSTQTGRYWLCRCRCGERVVRRTASLRMAGITTSCGCYRREKTIENNKQRCTTHGMAGRGHRPSTYYAWANMRSRCAADGKDAEWYYDKGVRVCDRWEDFSTFLADMGECPEGLTLDRKDGNGNYEPGNCRWASWDIQHNNKSDNRLLIINGESLTMAHAARKFNLNYNSLRSRVYILGLDAETAIFGDGGTIPPLASAKKGGKPVAFAKSTNPWRKK